MVTDIIQMGDNGYLVEVDDVNDMTEAVAVDSTSSNETTIHSRRINDCSKL